MLDKIRLNLFKLKSLTDLIGMVEFFGENTRVWFDEDGHPKPEFFEDRPCLLCGSSESYEVYKIDCFSYHRCENCASVYTRPHLKDGVLEQLYSNGIYQSYQDSLVKKSSDLRKGLLEHRKYQQIKSFLRSSQPKLLDVGCGSGTFLEVCNEHGWLVEGIDPGGKEGKQTNSIIHAEDFSKFRTTKKYDVISFWGVLEHMSNPVSALEKAAKMLDFEGLIVFEVPSADCILSKYLEKNLFTPTRYIESGRHNIFFSRPAIEGLAGSLGMDVVAIESNGLDIQTIFLQEFDEDLTDKIITIQDVVNDQLLGDHYRVFLRKN